MDQFELFQRLGIALAIGLMVGLERGWQSRADEDTDRAAGLRTFGLSGLLGGVCGALASLTHIAILVTGLVAFTAVVAAFSLLEARAERNFSATGTVAAILTFVLGAYAVLGQPAVAVAAAVVMTILLALRAQLHGLVRTITWLELRAILTLLAMTFLLLPILPDRAIDPWGAINPSEIWLLAILIAALSFVGYVLLRLTDDRVGIGLASITGGLTSSTATTLALARLARSSQGRDTILAGGIVVAGAVMMLRTIVIVGLIKPELGARVAPAIAVAALVMLGGGAVLLIRRGVSVAQTESGRLKLTNPFETWTVLKLAALIAVIGLLANVLAAQFGREGVLAVALLSGVADVDAATLSVARLSGADLAVDAAALAILVAVASNTFFKTAMATYVGGVSLGRYAALVGAASLAAMAAVFAAWPLGLESFLK